MRMLLTYDIRKWIINALAAFLFINICFLPAAQANDDATSGPSPAALPPFKVLEVFPSQAKLGDKITIIVGGLSKKIKQGKETFDPTKLILYFDDYPLDGMYPDSIDADQNKLVFTLVRNKANQEKWVYLLGSPDTLLRPTEVSVGFSDLSVEKAEPLKRDEFKFIVLKEKWFYGYIIALLIAIVLFLWLAKTSNIIRDSNPQRPYQNKRRPYSLAKLQASVWFFLVVASFLFIWLVTGDSNSTLTEQALVLMGIGTGTALGASMIDGNKREIVDSELYKLHPEKSKLAAEVLELKEKITKIKVAIKDDPPNAAQNTEELSKLNIELAQKEALYSEIEVQVTNVESALSKPVSEGLMKDLLADVNGISFHRFQMLIWTLVLGFIFCVEVYKTLLMPEFDTTLLALLGISAGTYLGFKIPERVS